MKKNNSGVFLIVSAASLWGTAGFFVRSMNTAGVAAMQIVLVRAVFSVVLLGAAVLVTDRGLFRVRLKDLWLFAATGLFSIVMFNFCYYKTMSLSTLSVAAVLLYTAPFFVTLLSAVLFRERLTAKKGIACICAFFGCCLVSGVFSGTQRIGAACIVYGLLTGFGYSLYTIFGNILLKRGYHSLTITFYTFVFAAIGSLPFQSAAKIEPLMTAGWRVFAIAVGMALFNTVAPYLLYTNGLKTVSPGRAPIIATVEPVVATILGIFAYGEKLSMQGAIGILLVLGSVIILNLKFGEKDAMQCSGKVESDA